MSAIIDSVRELVNASHVAAESGNVERALDLGKRAVQMAREELCSSELNPVHRAYYEQVVATVGAYIANPRKASAKTAGKESADTEHDRFAETDWFADPVPNLKLSDIAGLRDVKDAFITDVFAPFAPGYSDIYRKYLGSQSSLSLLLFGPPGVGKTHAVRCLAGELGCRVACVKVEDTNQRYVGDGSKMIASVFKQAAKYERSLIFFDEIDSIACSREGDESKNTREQLITLLQQLDGFSSNAKEGQLRIVIAASNRPWALDPAVLRRFDRRIYIPLPDLAAREKLVSIQLGKDETVKNRVSVPCAPDVSIEALAEKFDGYSGSDIKTVARHAVHRALRREIFSYSRGEHKPDCVTMADFDEVLKGYINVTSPEMLMQYEAYSRNMEYGLEFIKVKIDELLVALYNKVELGAGVEVNKNEISWLRGFYESGFVEKSFGTKYDLTFLKKVFEG